MKMLRRFLGLTLSFLPLLALAQPAPAPEKRVALLIGNSKYQHANPLRNPVNDTTDLSTSLKALGFQVFAVTNADKRTMESSVDNFVKTLAPGCVALFHFSGHGMQVDQENYLVPVDFELKDEASVKYDAYSASRLHDRMASAGSRLNIVILDACRNNGFATSRAGSSGLAAMHAARGSFIAFATAPGSTASDNPGGRNGLFTGALLDALKIPGLKLDDVFNRVRQTVYAASMNKQLAWSSSSVIGDFYFHPSGQGTAEPGRDLTVVSDQPQTVQIQNTRQQEPAPQPPVQSDEKARDEADDRLTKLFARASAVKESLDRLRASQASQGVGLRSDMSAAASQMEVFLNQADGALNQGNITRANKSMDQLETVLEKLEKFLGH